MQYRTRSWYPDPVALGGVRWWDGRWTDHVSWNGLEYRDHTPLEDVEAAATAQDAKVVRAYVNDAARRGLITESTANVLRTDLSRMTQPTPEPTPAPKLAPKPAPTAAPKPTTAAQPAPHPTPRPAPHATPRPAPRPAPAPAPAPAPTPAPTPRQEWWARTRATLHSDLAVHGLAYLGVVLLFCGVFGLIAFSFGDVDRSWRLVALVAAPTAFFLAAWFLRRRGATAVAAALTLLGGTMLPVVAVASLTDGAPPDVTGWMLPVSQALLCLAIASGEWWWCRRTTDSTLRWTAAPTMWLGVGVLLGVASDPIPTGEAVVRADAIQAAAMVAAIALTISWCRRNGSALARATVAVGVPVAAALVVIEALIASTEEWPVASGLIVAIAGLLIVEGAPHLGEWRAPLQSGLVVVGGLRLLPEVRPGWVSLITLLAALLLVEWSGRRGRPAEMPMVVAAAAALGALAEPECGFTAMSIVALWGTWRRVDPPEWLPVQDPFGVIAAIGSIGMIATFGWWTSPPTALLVLAAVALAAAVAVRISPRLDRDAMLRWWAPSAAVAAVVASVAVQPHDGHAVLAAALGGMSLVISRLPVPARVWLGVASFAWSAGVLGSMASLSLMATAYVVAITAATMVLLGALVDHPATLHLAIIGHLGGIAAVVVPGRTGVATAVAAAILAATWWSLTVLHEHGRAAHLELLPHELDTLPPLTAAAASVAAVLLTGRIDTEWAGLPFAIAGALLAAATFLPWRRASRTVLAIGGYAGAAVGVAVPASLDVARWPTIVGLALAVATTALIAERHPLYLWSAWAATAPLTVLVAEAVGLSRRWSDVAFAVWGATVLVGALTIDRVRSGPAERVERLRSDALAPPALLGGIAVVLGGISAMIAEPREVVGWLLVGLGAVLGAVAVLRPFPWLSFGGLGMITAGVAVLVPWTYEHPWSLAMWAMALATTAWAADRMPAWQRPLFLLAQVVAVASLPFAVVYDEVTLTFLTVAALSAAIAVILRSLPHTLFAALLVLVTAAAEGPGWLSLACMGAAIMLTVLAVRHPVDWQREVLLAGGALMTAGSWASFTVWQELAMSTVMVATVGASSIVVLLAALGLHRWPDIAAVWGGAGMVGLAVGVGLTGQPDVSTELARWTFATALVVVATAAVVVRARWAAVAALFGSMLLTHGAIGMNHPTTVLVGTIVAIALTFAGVVMHAMRPQSRWTEPLMGLMVAVQFAAALAFDGRSTTLAAILLVAAIETAALAVVSREPYVFLLSPAWALAAWLVIAADALRGDPNWFTVPIGIVALVEVSMIRWVRRTRPGSVYSREVATVLTALELGAMAVIIVPMLVQIVTLHLWYALPAIAAGTALATWGAITRVRRRLAFGAGAVAVAALLLIGVPVARWVPNLSGPALWLTVAALGAVAIVVATMLEQGRAQLHRWRTLLDEMTREWEHVDGADTAPHERDHSLTS